jgi:hypothetical protein
MALAFVSSVAFPIAGLIYGENVYARKLLPNLYSSSPVLGLPKAFGGVVLVNVVGSSIVLLLLGFKVSSAREACKKKALKDGDTDAEARFSYPKLYAEGFSEEAKKFNCAQRGHQQVLDFLSSIVLLFCCVGF